MKLSLRILGLCLLLSQSAFSTDWQRLKAPLMTTWGENIDPQNVLPEYPRPQMVRAEWMNLNGIWDYYKKPSVDLSYVLAYENFEKKILVPFPVESALSGIMDKDYLANTWATFAYRKTFTLPDAYKNKNVLLHFGAVDWKCAVYVNGKEAGTHAGGSDPFFFDITSLLNGRGEQEIQVMVYDPTNKGGQPIGKQIINPSGGSYTPVSGIWQTVWLEPVAKKHISDYSLIPDIDNESITLSIDPSVEADALTAKVYIKAAGKVINAVENMPVGVEKKIRIPGQRLWSPDDPFLYDLHMELYDKGTLVDAVDGYFGMRKIDRGMVDGHPCFMLNNKPVFQFGFLDQGWWPDGLLTPPSEEAMKFDLDMTKAFGMNMIRKHIKIEPARWYYWCDKMGLMVWQDMPSGGSLGCIGSKNTIRQNFYNECANIVKSLKNHPSILTWVVFNEGWGQDGNISDIYTRAGVENVQRLDKSRLVNAASGWMDFGMGDIIDCHTYPDPMLHTTPFNDRVAASGEYGGVTLKVEGHVWGKSGVNYATAENSEELTQRFNDLTGKIQGFQKEGIWGAVYTQTTDIEEELNGLITYDRKVVKVNDRQMASIRKEIESTIHTRIRTLLNASDVSDKEEWAYTTTKPADGWMRPDYNDNSWKRGTGGFGAVNPPNTFIRTEWNTADIYLRRSFRTGNLSQSEIDNIKLWIYYDDDCEVYINGVKAFEAKRWISKYAIKVITEEAKNTIKANSDNVMAIHVHQNEGGQYIDAGLVTGKLNEELEVTKIPASPKMPVIGETESVYLMSYYKVNEEHLFYAYSNDGLRWKDVNAGDPVFDAYNNGIGIRDPYIRRVTQKGKTKFHMVHAWGTDNPAIFHWESTDLVHWTAANGGTTVEDGKIVLMDGKNNRPGVANTRAPEFFYDEDNGMFYVYWSSFVDGRNVHYYTKTRDWKKFTTPAVFFDPGFSASDMTIIKHKDIYYAYYKDDRDGKKTILCATSKHIDPTIERFSGGNQILPSRYIEVEGPELFPLQGKEGGWMMTFDKFGGNRGLSYAACLNPSLYKWGLVPDRENRNPVSVKQGSIEIISRKELDVILKAYGENHRQMILPTAETEPQEWKYAFEQVDGWQGMNFDDSGWLVGQGGFGVGNPPGSFVNSMWDTSVIYLRKTIELGKDVSEEFVKNLYIRMSHDDDATIYINGRKVVEAAGYTPVYENYPVSSELVRKSILENKKIVIGVCCKQVLGEQYVDVGLGTVAEDIISGVLSQREEASSGLTYDRFLRSIVLKNTAGLDKPVCSIYDMNGSLVLNSKVTNDRVNVSSLEQGLYVAVVGNMKCKFALSFLE